MKIKDYLETLPDNINSDNKGLFGKELRILEPHFESIEELKGRKIEIIEEFKSFSVVSNGVNVINPLNTSNLFISLRIFFIKSQSKLFTKNSSINIIEGLYC